MSTQTQSTFTSRTAGLAETEADDTHVINGVAIGAGDVTHGLTRKSKVWQPDELRAAASTLEGAEIKALHSDAVVGEVTKAGFEPGVGVLYEAELEDEKLAAGVASGRLSVSIEATHFDGGTVDTPEGKAMAATNITFDGLAIVQKDAAPSASAKPGQAAALAVMPDEVHAALAGEEDVDLESAAAADIDDDVDEPADEDPGADGAGRDDPAGASSSSRDNDPASDDPDTETAAAAESNQTTDTTTTTSMSDDDDPEDVQELKARLSDKTERIDTLEEQVDELEEETERLSERAEAVDEAEEAYAEALAEHVPRGAEELQDDLSLDQMREWLADIDEANLAEDVEPSVRSGNDPSGTETANLSEAERERKSELEAKLSELEEKEGPLAEKEQERLEAELAEITGGDD